MPIFCHRRLSACAHRHHNARRFCREVVWRLRSGTTPGPLRILSLVKIYYARSSSKGYTTWRSTCSMNSALGGQTADSTAAQRLRIRLWTLRSRQHGPSGATLLNYLGKHTTTLVTVATTCVAASGIARGCPRHPPIHCIPRSPHGLSHVTEVYGDGVMIFDLDSRAV